MIIYIFLRYVKALQNFYKNIIQLSWKEKSLFSSLFVIQLFFIHLINQFLILVMFQVFYNNTRINIWRNLTNLKKIYSLNYMLTLGLPIIRTLIQDGYKSNFPNPFHLAHILHPVFKLEIFIFMEDSAQRQVFLRTCTLAVSISYQ